ncbi:hypothetical protein D3C87_1494600 [compost metagenome]
MIVEAILLAAGTLGFIHGDVRRSQQAVEIGPAIREGGNTDARAQGDIQAVDLLADRHTLNQLLGDLCRLLGELQVQ